MTRRLPRLRDERGAVLILAVLVVPLVFAIGSAVVDLGDFFEHRRVLQTKADASALAAGGRWTWPCSSTVDANMVASAREYVGYHAKADGSLHNSGPQLNDQVGGSNYADIHVALNAAEFWDDSPPEPADFSDGSGASPCVSQYMDVKVTEKDVNAFFGFITPDVKAKARVEIQQADTLSGLLPIAVRVPEPQSALVVFFNEANGAVLATRYLSRVQNSGSPVPQSLARWTTQSGVDLDGNVVAQQPATFTMIPGGGSIGVTVATSFFPQCASGGPTPCLEDEGFSTVNDVCRQGSGQVARCTYTTGSGSSQSVPYGLEKIRSYVDANVVGTLPNPQAPVVESAWLEPRTCGYLGQFGAYFNAVPANCRVAVAVEIDAGSGGTRAPDLQNDPFLYADDIRVRVAGGSCPENFNNSSADCQLVHQGGNLWRNAAGAGPAISGLLGTGFKVRVELRDTRVGGTNCPNFGAGGGCTQQVPSAGSSSPTNNVHRTFRGNDDATGPIKFFRVYDSGAVSEGSSNSKRENTVQTFTVDMGIRGAVATSQNDEPFAFDNKSNQSGTLDCDPSIPNIKQEIESGCSLVFSEADLTLSPLCPNQNMPQLYNNPNPPFDTLWPAFTCVSVQTTSGANQIKQGFNLRVFKQQNDPTSCPQETGDFTPGRNYWHNSNNPNDGDVWTFPNINPNDPRLVTLFLTEYDSVLGSGNANYPIVGFAQFYVTGWGDATGPQGQNLTIVDPCPGNTPPADLETSSGGTYVWGHLVKGIAGPTGGFGGTGELCNPARLNPCVPVLVE